MNQRALNWDKAVPYDVALQRGEVTAFHTQTPLSALLAAESGGASDPDTARSLILRMIMAYLFSASAHPAHVTQRLYLMAKEVCPVVLKPLAASAVFLLTADTPQAHTARMLFCLRGTHAFKRPVEAHEAIVQETLRAAHHRHPQAGLAVAVSLEDALRFGEVEMLQNYTERLRLISAGLHFFFAEGPQPELAVVRVFALAKAQFPELIVNMNVRQLGALFGVTGASWSERIKRKFNAFLETRGAHGVRAHFQKSPEACATYSRVQRGNRNRRCGKRRRSA